MRSVLRLPAYRRLLTAYTLNELALAIGSLALTVLVYRRTGSALAAAGYFIAAQFGPALIAPTLATRLGARPPRSLLPALYGAEAVAYAVLAVLTRHFALAPVLVLALLDGILALTARSVARTASVDVLTPAGLLREGNAASNAAFSICFFAGPAIGGVGVASGGIETMLFVVAGAFGAMVLTLLTTHGLPEAQPQRSGVRLRSAIGEARSAPAVGRLVLLWGAVVIFLSITIPVEIVLVRHSLHASDGAYGALLSAQGIGALIGSAVYSRVHHVNGRAMITATTALMAAGFLGLAAAPDIAVALGASVVAGVGNGMLPVAFRTEFQERAPDQLMAALTALYEAIGQITYGVGILVGGAVTSLAGPRPAFVVAAVGSVAMAGLVAAVLAAPDVLTPPSESSVLAGESGVLPES